MRRPGCDDFLSVATDRFSTHHKVSTLASARDLRIKAASTGLRKPVNVIEGNYHRMPGVCPWWDGMLRDEAAE